MKKFVSLLLILVLALSLGVGAFAMSTLKEANDKLYQAKEYDTEKQSSLAAMYYYGAADIYEDLGMYTEALDAYKDAKRCYTECNNTYMAGRMQDYIDEIVHNHPELASTISEGSLAIVTAVAGVAVGLGGGWLLFGRKKKSAEA